MYVLYPERSVSIVNEMKDRAEKGEQIFCDIYMDAEKQADPAKRNTGLFFFRGNPGEKFAITNSGGGFVYVAAMHDSFPHMQELARRGYNAFALIYRPGAQSACENLAEPLPLSTNILGNSRWIRKGIRCGAAQPERVWRPGLVPTEPQHLEKRFMRKVVD